MRPFLSMSLPGLSLFDTPLGRCGVAWTDRGVGSVLLPDADAALRSRLSRRFPDAHETAPPPDVRQGIEAMTDLLSGKPVDLSFVSLDMNGVPEFNQRVYEAARLIRLG